MSSKDKKNSVVPKSFWKEGDPEIDDEARAILTTYGGVAEDQLVPHVREVREKAWKVFQYPCVGLYSFVKFSISHSELYPTVLERVKHGETLLDLACGFGQDVRKLVYDGAPAENLTGTELEQGFLESGYDLFNDKHKLKARLTSGDFFAPETAGLQEHSFDVIYTANFFHLFSWDEQVEAVSKALGLLKTKSGSMMFGRQTAVAEAGPIKVPIARSGVTYRHNVESFRKLVAEVADKTGLDFAAEVELIEEEGRKVGGAFNMMSYRFTMR
ncbi:hypothetical protein LTR85_003055 [Meristemomyces frigidus]|nr:hypothetical protein LTR85_003055 [Meristemomyces frigidus]